MKGAQRGGTYRSCSHDNTSVTVDLLRFSWRKGMDINDPILQSDDSSLLVGDAVPRYRG